jgi:hypothetical protein
MIETEREALQELRLAKAHVERAQALYGTIQTRNSTRIRAILKDTVWEYLDGHAIPLVECDIDREIPWHEKEALCQNDNNPRVARGWMSGFPVNLCASCATIHAPDFDRIEYGPKGKP